MANLIKLNNLDETLQNLINSTDTFGNTGSLGMLIPLFVEPTDILNNSAYNNIMDLAKKYVSSSIIVILNPDNGPGSSADTNYQTAIKRLVGSGISVAGYIDAENDSKSLIDIQNEIINWTTFYPETAGIYIDNILNNITMPALYSDISYYINNNGLNFLIGNIGNVCDKSFFTAFDIIIISDDEYSNINTTTLKDDTIDGLIEINPVNKSILLKNTTYNYSIFDELLPLARWIYISEAVDWTTLSNSLEQQIIYSNDGGYFRIETYTDNGQFLSDTSSFTVNISEYDVNNDLLLLNVGGTPLTKDVDYTINPSTKVVTKINTDEATWDTYSLWDLTVVKIVK